MSLKQSNNLLYKYINLAETLKKEGVMMMMMKKAVSARGCIKTTRGPWVVHRTTKDGRSVSRLRVPSERERENNRERGRRRRAVAKRIFDGLRAHGKYELPRHADTNDLLMALCTEAGWTVQPDGTIFRKMQTSNNLQQSKKPVFGDDDDHAHQQIDLSLSL